MRLCFLLLACLLCFPALCPAFPQASDIVLISFLESSLIATPGASGLKKGDFNGDGNQDLLITDTDGSPAWAVLKNVNGGFGQPSRISRPGPVEGFTSAGPIIIGDMDGDGRDELVHAVKKKTSSASGNAEIILLVNRYADSSFRSSRRNVRVSGLDRMHEDFGLIAGTDINGDGMIDVLLGTGTGNRVYHLLGGLPDAEFILAEPVLRGEGLQPYVYLDVDRDGTNDILRTPSGKTIIMHEKGFHVSCGPPGKSSSGPDFENPFFPSGPNPGRRDGCSEQDIFLFNSGSAGAYLYDSKAGKSSSFNMSRVAEGYEHVIKGDFNNDGLDDLVFYGGGDGIVIQPAIPGGYRPVQRFLSGQRVISAAVIDANNDMLADLAVIEAVRSEVRILVNITQTR